MFVVTVYFEIVLQHVSAFRNAMLRQAAESLNVESSCRQFDVCFDPDNESLCFLYERYDDRAAFDAHLQSEHFQNFDATVAPWIVTKDVRTWVHQNPTVK